MSWENQKTLKFIRLYQMHTCLWDRSSRDYNVRSKRDQAVNTILAEMNIPDFTPAACRMKIKNIRSQYSHELKRVRLSMKGGGKVHKPTLAWFDTVDRFLRPTVVHRTLNLLNEKQPFCGQTDLADQTSSDMVDLESVAYSKKNVEDTSNEETVIKTEEIDLSDLEAGNVYEGQTPEPYPPSGHSLAESTSTNFALKYELDAEDGRQESESLKFLATAIKKFENSVIKITPTSSSNEFDVFGQSVAAQLCNMPLEDALQLQMEIQQLITTKRVDKLRRAQDNRR